MGVVSSTESTWREIDRRGAALDVILLAAVPVVLLLVFALPVGWKESLALSYADPTVRSAFTSHYVHFSAGHLLTNVLGYVLVVSTVYLVATAVGRRQQFFVVFSVFLLALPFGLSAFNLLFPRTTYGVGFSGIVLAFLGYLPMVLTPLLGRQLGISITGVHSNWLFFFGLGVISFAAVPGLYGAGIAAVAVLAGILVFRPVIEKARREGIRKGSVVLVETGSAELVIAGVAIFVTYPLVVFLQGGQAFGSRVNVYTHVVGFCLGYIVPYTTLLVVGFDWTKSG